jgi:predicted PurR-regulated permease PerM
MSGLPNSLRSGDRNMSGLPDSLRSGDRKLTSLISPEEGLILKLLLWAAAVLASVYLLGIAWTVLGQFGDIVLLIFLAWLLSFILGPWVDGLAAAGLPRPASAGLVYLLVGTVVILVGLTVTPLLIDQTNSLVSSLSFSRGETPAWVKSLQESLGPIGNYIDFTALAKELLGSFQTFSTLTLATTVGLATSLISVFFEIFLILLFSFYFVIDGDRLWRVTLVHLPTRYHQDLEFIKTAVATSFSGFLRTQVLLGVLMGVLTFLVLALFGVEFALTAAAFAAVVMIVPVLGPILSLIPPVIVTGVSQPGRLLLVLIILFVLQVVLVQVVGPLLFKRTIGLHPVLVLISFLIGFKLAGVWGAVFAVPIAAVALIIGSQLLRHYLGKNEELKLGF